MNSFGERSLDKVVSPTKVIDHHVYRETIPDSQRRMMKFPLQHFAVIQNVIHIEHIVEISQHVGVGPHGHVYVRLNHERISHVVIVEELNEFSLSNANDFVL
jgi:hypothetical protein